MSAGSEPSSDLAAFTARAFKEVGGWMLIAIGVFGVVNAVEVAVSGAVLSAIFLIPFMLLFVLSGAVLAPSVRRRVDHRHSLGSFGRSPVVERRVVRPEEYCHERCVVCNSSIEAGLVRRYREDITVAGIPLIFGSNSYNHYCLDCARAEMGKGKGSIDLATDVADAGEHPLHDEERELETESA